MPISNSMDKLWYIQMEFCSVRMNDLQLNTTKWMNIKKHNVEQKFTGTEGYILHGPTYIKYNRKPKLIYTV